MRQRKQHIKCIVSRLRSRVLYGALAAVVEGRFRLILALLSFAYAELQRSAINALPPKFIDIWLRELSKGDIASERWTQMILSA